MFSLTRSQLVLNITDTQAFDRCLIISKISVLVMGSHPERETLCIFACMMFSQIDLASFVEISF